MSEDRGAGHPTDTALYFGVAAGVIAATYLPCALAGWFVRSPIGLLWPLSVAFCLGAVMIVAARELRPWNATTVLLAAGALLFLAALAPLELLPPVARDELTHHLAVPALFVRAGRIVPIPFADQAHYPMLVTLLYTPLVARGWESAAKLLHLAFGIGAAAVVFTYLRARTSGAIALFTAVLLLTTPTVAILGASAYVDLGLLFFSAIAVVALLRWTETDDSRLLVVMGLAAGLSATVKYNGFLLVPLLGAAVVFLSDERRPTKALTAALVFGVTSLLPLLPWLAKNLWETGNPIYPLFNGVLGNGPLPSRPSIDVFSYRRALYGESWPMVLLVPLRVFLTGSDGNPALFDGVFNPIYLAGFGLALFSRHSRRDRILGCMSGVLLFLVLFLVVFRSRYAIAALVPLALLTATAAHRAWQSARWRTATVAAAAGALLFNAMHLAAYIRHMEPQAYLLGGEGRAAYVTRFVPEYPVAAWANLHLPAEARVYLAFLGERGYYWDRPYTYDFHYSGIALLDAVRASSDAAEVAAALRRAGISHIACADFLLEQFMRRNLEEGERERWEHFASEQLRLLHRQRGIGLYEVVAPGLA